MSNLLKYISEYFLGTETRKFYEDAREFYKKSFRDPANAEKLIQASKIEEKMTLIVGKYIPNLIDIVGIVHSISTKSPPYIVLLGEVMRLSFAIPDYQLKKSYEKLQSRAIQL